MTAIYREQKRWDSQRHKATGCYWTLQVRRLIFQRIALLYAVLLFNISDKLI